jgi:hypothetical protein
VLWQNAAPCWAAWPTVERDLISAPASPRAAAGRRKARAAHGPSAEIDGGAAGRSPPATRRKAQRLPSSPAATTWERARFHASQPRCCFRTRQATARPAKYSAAPGRPAPQVETCPPAVFHLPTPGEHSAATWPGFPEWRYVTLAEVRP